MAGELINYQFGPMSQGAVDMAGANRQITELQSQFEDAMKSLLGAWRSQAGSPQLQQVQLLWTQTNGEINLLLGRRGQALDEAAIGMKRADNSAATYLEA